MAYQPLSHPAVLDALACVRRELGDGAAIELVTTAAWEAVQYALEDPPVPAELAEEEAAYRVWWALWQQFALRKPDAFGPRLRRLRRCASLDLAFVHARCRAPETLPRLALSASERRDCQRGRARLRQWTGLDALDAPGRVWTVSEGCLPLRALRSLTRYQGAFAVAMGGEWALRRDSIIWQDAVAELRDGAWATTLPDGVLHEEIHNALNVAAPFIPGRCDLTFALNEAVTVMAEYAARCERLDGVEPTRGRVIAELVGHENLPAVRCLLKTITADAPTTAWLGAQVGLVLAAHRAPDTRAVAALLNQHLDARRSPRQWLRALAA